MLAQASPLTSDPAGFRAVVELPDGVAIPENGVTVHLGAARTDTKETVGGTFTLSNRGSARYRLFRMEDADAEQFRRLQSQIADWKWEAEDATSGTFSVAATVCTIGEGPAPDARYSVNFSTQADAPLVPLIRDAPVSEIIKVVNGDTTCRDAF